MDGVLDCFTNWLIRRRWLLLGASVVLTIIAWPISLRLQFDQSIESMYAPTNPQLLAFLRSKRAFGGDEFLIVTYRDPEVFDADGKLTPGAQERLERLGEQVGQLPGVQPDSVQHLGTALRSPYGRSKIRQFVEGVLVGPDGKTVAVMGRLLPIGESTTPRAETFRKVRELAAAHDPPAVVVGEPIQVHDMFRYVEEDGFTLGLWSAVLLMAVIFLLFRSWRWMFLPLLVVQATLIWTKALLVLSGLQLSMVSSMLDSLVTIIVIATVTHLTVRFREERKLHDRERALYLSMRELVMPIFWVTVTTAAGFAALLTCSISPVASFGLMMTLATMLLLVAAAGVLPGGVLLGRTTSIPATAPAEAPVTRALGKLTESVEARPLLVWLLMALFSAFFLMGFVDLRIETDFSKNFRANSPIVQALDLFETHLGGAGTWEVNFATPEELTEEFLDDVQALADDLRELEQRQTTDRLTKVIAVTDGLSLIPRDIFFARVPLSTRLGFLDRIQPDFLPGLYNADEQRMRIVLRAMERQPSESKLKLIADVERLARARFPEGQAEATGLFVLLAHLVESLMDDQVVSSLLAAAAMVVLMQLAFRNVWLSLILLVPNVFPIVVVIGTMGWLDMKLNVGTAMIAAVSMGLTIDSSIIYIAEYQAARQRGLNFAEALKETHQGVGLALVFSNVALVVGFTVLMLSNFVPLIYFGLLVSVAMVGGLIGNLILLPLLLRLVDRAPTLLIPTPSGDSPLLPPLPGGGQGGAEGNPP